MLHVRKIPCEGSSTRHSKDCQLSLSLSLWRWTRIEETNESDFAAVWKEETLFLSPDRQTIRDKLDTFAIAFAADYLRANR